MNSHYGSRSQIEEKKVDPLGGEVVKQRDEGEANKKRGFLRLPQVLEIIPMSKSTWWKGIKEGRFPKPVKLSARTSAWSRVDIDALCDQFVATGVEKNSSREGAGF